MIKRKLGSKGDEKVCATLIAALYNHRTRYSALESTNQAINFIGSIESADYIRNN